MLVKYCIRLVIVVTRFGNILACCVCECVLCYVAFDCTLFGHNLVPLRLRLLSGGILQIVRTLLDDG